MKVSGDAVAAVAIGVLACFVVATIVDRYVIITCLAAAAVIVKFAGPPRGLIKALSSMFSPNAAGGFTSASGPAGAGAGAGAGSGGGCGDNCACADTSSQNQTFGFHRDEFGSEPLKDTTDTYHRHFFLVSDTPPSEWAAKAETPLFAKLKDLCKTTFPAGTKTRLTMCYSPDGKHKPDELLVFPDLISYPPMDISTLESVFEEHFSLGRIPRSCKPLNMKNVFVCCHAQRDMRCGVCGPPLVETFKKEVARLGLSDEVNVMPCSHVGGHRFAGNVIVFGRTKDCGSVVADWYGYVTPARVPDLLAAMQSNTTVPELWRGSMQ